MSDNHTESRLYELVAAQADVDMLTIQGSMSLIDDLGLDSLDAIELIMATEEEFDIEIPTEDAERMVTVSDILDHVKKTLDEEDEDE